MRDRVEAQVHYLYCLTPPNSHVAAEIVTVKMEGVSGQETRGPKQAMVVHPQFNDLLLHKADMAYGVKLTRASADPADGLVLLDGYMW